MNTTLKVFVILISSMTLFIQDTSLANDQLRGSIAKLMKVESKYVKLKKQKLGMTSSQNYIFEINKQKFVLKLFKKRIKLESRKNEIEAIKILSKLELGPKLVAIAGDNSFYIREYANGGIAKPSDFQNEKFLINLAKTLRKLHNYNTNINTKKTLENRLEKHYNSIKRKKIALPSGFEESYEKFKALYAKLPKYNGFCHNDLNPLNIIASENGVISFIDLENCGNANIYEELGYITLLCGIFDENLKFFLKNYFEKESVQTELEAIKLAQKLTCLLTSVVWFDFSESKKDKKMPIETRQKSLDDLLNSVDLKSAKSFITEGKTISIRSRNKLLIKQYALAFYKLYLTI